MRKKTGPVRVHRARRVQEGLENFSVLPDLDPSKPIRAELIGSERCEALGIVAVSSSPVLLLCRKLIRAGVHPGTPLLVYRGWVLCLRIHSLAEAAGLLVGGDGVGFRPIPEPDTGSPSGFGDSPYEEAAE
jgi:hypothetical protein